MRIPAVTLRSRQCTCQVTCNHSWLLTLRGLIISSRAKAGNFYFLPYFFQIWHCRCQIAGNYSWLLTLRGFIIYPIFFPHDNIVKLSGLDIVVRLVFHQTARFATGCENCDFCKRDLTQVHRKHPSVLVSVLLTSRQNVSETCLADCSRLAQTRSGDFSGDL
jgi:hypothetical protein